MKYYIDGKEVSALEKLQHKLKQLNEASNLLELNAEAEVEEEFEQTIRYALV